MASLRVKQSGKIVKEIVLDESKSYLAGRKEGADIFMEAAKAISREHFILKYDQAWIVEVLSRFGDIQFNNDRVRQFTLQEDSVFSIFPYDFEFIKEDRKIIAAPAPIARAEDPVPDDYTGTEEAGEFDKTRVGGIQFLPHIQFVSENQFSHNTVVLPDQNEWVAGRDSKNEIFIDDHRVSRKQFKILKEGTSYFILDLGSVNGTSVNGKVIIPNEKAPILSGDKIQVLDSIMLFELKNRDFEEALKKIKDLPVVSTEGTSNYPISHTGVSMVGTRATQNSLVHYTSEQAPLPSMFQNQNQGVSPYVDPNALNYNYQSPPMPDGEFEDDERTFGDKKNQVRLLLVAGVVLVFMFVGYNEFLAPKKPAKGTVKTSDPFSKINPNELSLMKQSYEIATDYYFKKSYQLSYDETQKIIKKMEDAGIPYLKTKFGMEVDDLAKKSSLAIESEKELMRHAKELETRQKSEQLVATVYNECDKRLNSNPDMTIDQYGECARDAIAIDPGHPQKQTAELRIQTRLTEKNMKAAQQKAYRERVARMQKVYNRAFATEKSGNLVQAIDDYKNVLKQDLPDPEELKGVSQRKIAAIQKLISSRSTKFVDDAEKFVGQKKYKDAINEYRKAQKVNPLDDSFDDRVASLKRDLAKEIKPIWDEAVIEEQYNQVECMENKSCAIEKWKKVLEMDVKDGEYYSKALAKLKKYGAH